jgi:hypothetical protein
VDADVVDNESDEELVMMSFDDEEEVCEEGEELTALLLDEMDEETEDTKLSSRELEPLDPHAVRIKKVSEESCLNFIN